MNRRAASLFLLLSVGFALNAMVSLVLELQLVHMKQLQRQQVQSMEKQVQFDQTVADKLKELQK